MSLPKFKDWSEVLKIQMSSVFEIFKTKKVTSYGSIVEISRKNIEFKKFNSGDKLSHNGRKFKHINILSRYS